VDETAYRERHPVPEGGGIFMTASAKAWPMWSDAAGCHPDDAAKFSAGAAALGVPTEFSAVDGRAKFTSREHQKKYCQAVGLINRDENWSGRGSKVPPPPPKKRPKIGNYKLVESDKPPEMRTATEEAKETRRRKSVCR
jgi:hypothetical protein